MQAPDIPIVRDIVLIGGGHSHVGVLKSFGMKPISGVRLTLICTDLLTPYSGMLPGYVAGHYSFDEVHIDLLRLAQFAGARLYCDEVIGIDRNARQVLCKNRPPVAYDLLSINIGATPQLHDVPGAAEHAVAVKPIRLFNERWLALLERVKTHTGPFSIAVVGAGAGGVELLLAMQYRLRHERIKLGQAPDTLRFHLLSGGPNILPTHNAGVRHRFAEVLTAREVQVHCHAQVTQVTAGALRTAQGLELQADEIIWVTSAGGAEWLRNTGLQLDAQGFIMVKDTLQTLDDPMIFAAGDVASMVNFKLEKAGVFAVRMGKPLTQNLRRAVSAAPLQAYRPQNRWLALISTGDAYAVASRGWFGVAGHWVWRWKDWIDRRFMRRFSEFAPSAMNAQRSTNASHALSAVKLQAEESSQAISAMAMRCGGCAAKVGANVLQRALSQLRPLQKDDVLIGLNHPDDAAVVRVPPGMLMVHSVDFFRAFIDDPYLFGKIAANHALGDIWAMGAQAQTATAVCCVPPGVDAKVQDVLRQMMSGALEVLNEANCALVGGHSSEGKELALGFAINGLIEDAPNAALRKGAMQAGDCLILTKPLGSGTLFAAKDRLFAKGRWIEAALQNMLVSNRHAAQIVREHDCHACTDITGFGLLGHLLEMTRPSKVDAQISLSALPLLDGARECVGAGITSSLQSANLRQQTSLRNARALASHPNYPLIFDPQTAGGLLASVPAARANACVAALQAAGYTHACQIGVVMPLSDSPEPIVLTN